MFRKYENLVPKRWNATVEALPKTHAALTACARELWFRKQVRTGLSETVSEIRHVPVSFCTRFFNFSDFIPSL